MNRLALLRIRDVLLDADKGTLPPGIDTFCMGVWRRDQECGTAACAIGLYMAAYPKYLDGLKLVREVDGTAFFIPELEDVTGFEAVAAHLDIKLEDASKLFDPLSYYPLDASPKMVAARIERFLHDND